MECFVDEMPKDCLDCPFCQDIKVNAGMDRLLFCKANKGKAIKNIEKSFDKCIVKNEFQSLTDYTKQVRKEVYEKIIKSIHYYPIALLDIDKEPRIKTLGISKEVLDTILKEYQK